MPPIQSIAQATRPIHDADALVIAAGAGMGVDSGLPDFRETEGYGRVRAAQRTAALSAVRWPGAVERGMPAEALDPRYMGCLSRPISFFSRFRTARSSGKLTDHRLMYYAPRNTIRNDPVVQLQGNFGAV